jgi:hypothetical protein
METRSRRLTPKGFPAKSGWYNNSTLAKNASICSTQISLKLCEGCEHQPTSTCTMYWLKSRSISNSTSFRHPQNLSILEKAGLSAKRLPSDRPSFPLGLITVQVEYEISMTWNSKRVEDTRMSIPCNASSRCFNTRIMRSVRSLSFFFSFYRARFMVNSLNVSNLGSYFVELRAFRSFCNDAVDLSLILGKSNGQQK